MRNIKLTIEYDGNQYAGWQRQKSVRTVQGEIENSLVQILQEDVNLIGAGRTDAGVHARAQVANFKTSSSITTFNLMNALNSVLPEDIVIHNVEEVDLNFNARYSAKSRVYSYIITRSPSALQRNYCWYVKYSLNTEYLQRAAQMILGTRDFGSFCRTGSDVLHTRCTVEISEWLCANGKLQYFIQADRFLRGMVRALVGTMVDVGRGFTPLAVFEGIINQKNRSKAGMTAPAKGLFLEKIIY